MRYIYCPTNNHRMKTRSIFKNMLLLTCMAAIGLQSCSESCDNEEPRAKIVNNGTDKASVQIKTSGGNTENINNIESGQTSDWRTFAAGNTEFTVVIQGMNDTVVTVNMLQCYEYSIDINAQNRVSSTAVERD